MRLIYTLCFTFCSVAAFSQNFYMDAAYVLGAPQQKMNDNINPLHTLSLGGRYQVPGTNKRLELGAEAGWGTYANTSKQQTFNFPNGSTTITQVNYSSNVLQAAATGRFLLCPESKLTAYISGKLGYASFYSNIFIEDPHDVDGCQPLDQKNIIRDGTFMAGYGGGLRADVAFFCKDASKKRMFVDLGVQSVRGGNLDYINTKKLIDASAPPPPGEDGKAVSVKFINATTNEIHEHQVAEVYTTPLRMLEFRLSWVFLLE